MRHEVSSKVREEGLCDLPFAPLLLDVAQRDGDERSVWFREREQHLTISTERYARRADRSLAKVTHGLATAQMKF
jgi:hypothetical protein